MSTQRKTTKGRSRARRNKSYVVVTNRGYGQALRGTKIFFEGTRPKGLKDDGSITFGKHILETLRRRFQRFHWVITAAVDSITPEGGIARVRISQKLLARMNREYWERARDIKTEIVRRFLWETFPTHFAEAVTSTYVPGTLANILAPSILPRLSADDKEALTAFIPDYVASEAIGTVEKLKASAQIETLKALAKDFERQLSRSHPESWWQSYVKGNILLIQQGYIKALDRLNVAIGETKFPDFCLVTHDNYIDILEIKKPDTPLLKLDQSRGNYYWDSEMAKAISQTENYIDQITSKADALRSYLLDEKNINVKAIRPRGIILAGNARTFTEQKQHDDFRLLSQGIKNVMVLTYDELLTRLTNYIGVLEDFARRSSVRRSGVKSVRPLHAVDRKARGKHVLPATESIK